MTVESPLKRKHDNDDDPDTPSKKERKLPFSDSPKKPKNMAEFDQRKRFKEFQKAVTPPVADPTRGFYESLLKEKPDSKIAIKWVVENGVFGIEEHAKLVKKYIKLRDAGSFNAAQQLQNVMAQKKKQENNKEKKGEKKEKKEGKEPKEGKEKKDKKEKKAENGEEKAVKEDKAVKEEKKPETAGA